MAISFVTFTYNKLKKCKHEFKKQFYIGSCKMLKIIWSIFLQPKNLVKKSKSFEGVKHPLLEGEGECIIIIFNKWIGSTCPCCLGE